MATPSAIGHLHWQSAIGKFTHRQLSNGLMGNLVMGNVRIGNVRIGNVP
jgi:hypothetical protein